MKVCSVRLREVKRREKVRDRQKWGARQNDENKRNEVRKREIGEMGGKVTFLTTTIAA